MVTISVKPTVIVVVNFGLQSSFPTQRQSRLILGKNKQPCQLGIELKSLAHKSLERWGGVLVGVDIRYTEPGFYVRQVGVLLTSLYIILLNYYFSSTSCVKGFIPLCSAYRGLMRKLKETGLSTAECTLYRCRFSYIFPTLTTFPFYISSQ